MKIEKRLLADIVGISMIVSGVTTVGLNTIKLYRDEIDNIKMHNHELVLDSYNDELDNTFVGRSFEEDSKYVVVQTDRKHSAWDYCAIEDLVVVTNDKRESTLVDTNTHYFYKDVLDYSKLESFVDYLISQLIKTSDYETREFIKNILSDDKSKIEILDENMLSELHINNTSFDIIDNNNLNNSSDESYNEGLKEAYIHRACEEDRKYVYIEIYTSDKDNLPDNYFAVDDLVVATNEQNENILVDTKKHYYYEELLDYCELKSFEEYLADVYVNSNDDDIKDCINRIMSEEKWFIETIDSDRLLDLGITKNADDIFWLESSITSDNVVTESIVNIEEQKRYPIKK